MAHDITANVRRAARSLDSHATLRKEERRTPGSETQGVPLFGILPQGVAGRRIERNKARFSKLMSAESIESRSQDQHRTYRV